MDNFGVQHFLGLHIDATWAPKVLHNSFFHQWLQDIKTLILMLMSVCRLYGAGLGPRLYKTNLRASCSEAGAEEPPAAQPLQKTAPYSLSPVGSHYWVSIGEVRLFSLPSLALGWEKLGLRWIQRLCPGGGGIMLYTIQSLLHRCCGLPSLKWGGVAFSRLENFWRYKRRFHLPKSSNEKGKRESVYVGRLCLWESRAKLQSDISFIRPLFIERASHSACLCSSQHLW